MIGFAISISPYLILNFILYNHAFSPFLQQIFLSSNSGWSNYHSIPYYFTELFKENFLYLLFIPGLILLFKRKSLNKTLIAVTFLVSFIFFNSIKQKEMRFLIILLPYMYLLVSVLLLHFLSYFKNKSVKILFFMVVILSIILSVNTTYTSYKNEFNKNNQYAVLQNMLMQISHNGEIWVSNPVMTVSTSRKIGKLMYYPVFNEEKKNELINDFKSADFIFFDSCDLACKSHDTKCEDDKSELLGSFKQQLKTTYSSSIKNCQQFIFQK